MKRTANCDETGRKGNQVLASVSDPASDGQRDVSRIVLANAKRIQHTKLQREIEIRRASSRA